MDPARTACCSDLLPRLRKIERVFLVKYPAVPCARLSWASVLGDSGSASRVLHILVPISVLAPSSHCTKPKLCLTLKVRTGVLLPFFSP